MALQLIFLRIKVSKLKTNWRTLFNNNDKHDGYWRESKIFLEEFENLWDA